MARGDWFSSESSGGARSRKMASYESEDEQDEEHGIDSEGVQYDELASKAVKSFAENSTSGAWFGQERPQDSATSPQLRTDGLSQEDLELVEEHAATPRDKWGKPLSEIDIFVRDATEQRARQRRKQRAAEAELALEQENDAKKFGTVKGATRKRLLLGQKQRSISMVCCSLFGILLMLIQLQVAWNGDEMEENSLETTLKFMITFSTLFLEYLLYDYYTFALHAEMKDRNFRPETLTIRNSAYFYHYLLEAFVLLLHTPPWIAQTGIVTDKFGMCMFLRVYLFIRVLRDLNPVYARALEYQKHDTNRVNQFEFSSLYFFKFQFWEQPLLVMLVTSGLTFCLSIYGFYITERERVPWVYDFDTSIWFVSTTMTTVGYGVYTPDDALGRMFAMMAAFAAMLLLAMMSAILAKFVELKYNEAVGIGWSSRQDRQSAFTSAAAKLIQVSYRLSLTGRLRWSARRKLASHEAAEFAMAIARFKKMRIKIDESKVQGDGGYLIVMERIASAQEDIHVQMDACEKKLDASIDSIMSNIMYQLTKMEEMQGMVLDANFETIRNNIVKIDKRMRQINKGHAVDDGDDN